MSTAGGPKLSGIGRSGDSDIVLCLDAGTYDSFAGEPATNLVPDAGGVYGNSRFTTANGWATYQTNQYNSNTYFDIGVIGSVTGNEITMSSWSRTLYSFDALRPQTTGGGVTAGWNYFIFFIGGTSSNNSNSFEIYTYNASQNGSQGYINAVTGYPAVYNGILDNGRRPGSSGGSQGSGIVTLTGTPTDMWWGPPHLPNTSIVKEVAQGGGRINGTPCMRFNCPRSWRGMAGDGMAYGVYPPVTAGDTIRLSFWHRPSPFGFGGAGCAGKSPSWSTYFGANPAGSSTFYLSSTVGEWKYETHTWTASVTYNFYIYFWPPTGSVAYSLDIADLMVTVNDGGAVPWVGGTRSNSNSGDSSTGGWVDLSGNDNSGDFSNDMGPDNLFHFRDNSVMRLMTDSTNSTTGSASTDPMFINFDGTDDYVNCGDPGASLIGTNGTVCVWVNPSDLVNDRFIWSKNATGGSTTYVTARLASSGKVAFALYGGWGWSPTIYTVNPLVIGEWTHLAFTWYTDGLALYRDGVLQNTAVESGTWGGGGTNSLWFGSSESNQPGDWNGKMAAAQLYRKTLSASEIKQNFNSQRSRFQV